MFRPIRRKAKEKSLETAKSLLKNSRIGILAVNGDDGYPYAVPINFLYDEESNKIYFHGAKSGHKFDSLKKDNKVCFTVCGKETVKAEEWAPFCESTVIFGKCNMLEYGEESLEKLRKVAEKYYPDEQTIDEEMDSAAKACVVFEIEIEHISVKEIQEK